MSCVMVYEICAAIITLVIVVLTFFLIDLIKKLKTTLIRVNKLTFIIETKLIPISDETTKILENTKNLTETINGQVSALDPMFHSISRLGNSFQEGSAKG